MSDQLYNYVYGGAREYSKQAAEARHAAAALFALPLDNAERARLRDQVPLAAPVLERKARKFLTLSAEYAERETFAKRRTEALPSNVYPAWAQGTRQSPAVVKVPYFGTDDCQTVAQYVRAFDRLNCLRGEA